jgi:hypothetical protein
MISSSAVTLIRSGEATPELVMECYSPKKIVDIDASVRKIWLIVLTVGVQQQAIQFRAWSKRFAFVVGCTVGRR